VLAVTFGISQLRQQDPQMQIFAGIRLQADRLGKVIRGLLP
jgi:hypothetical protein